MRCDSVIEGIEAVRKMDDEYETSYLFIHGLCDGDGTWWFATGARPWKLGEPL